MSNDWSFLTKIPPINGRYIVLDTETTGLYPQSDHAVEIAACEVINGKLTGMKFQCYIKPRTNIKKDATQIHKMDNDYYTKYHDNSFENERQLLVNLLNFIGDSMIITHNAPFDFSFFSKEVDFNKLKVIPKERYRCTMRMFKDLVRNQKEKISANLENVANYFKIELDPLNLHSASYDAFLCARVFCKILEVTKVDVLNINTNTLENKGLNSKTFGPKTHSQGRPNLVINLNNTTRAKSPGQLKMDLLNKTDDVEELKHEKLISVTVSDLDDLSLNYSDSMASTNTLTQSATGSAGLTGPTDENSFYDNTDNLKKMNRTYVISATGGNEYNEKTFSQKHIEKRLEMEDKLDKKTLKIQFEKLNK